MVKIISFLHHMPHSAIGEKMFGVLMRLHLVRGYKKMEINRGEYDSEWLYTLL